MTLMLFYSDVLILDWVWTELRSSFAIMQCRPNTNTCHGCYYVSHDDFNMVFVNTFIMFRS